MLGSEPYADFSVLTPYGRRTARQLRHRGWLPQEDGTYKPVELPGPGDLATWEKCFRVYEVILLMLKYPSTEPVITPIALETYFQHFKKLASDHYESWYLCQQAEDRCRAEHMPRLRRRLCLEAGRDPTWSDVFIAAALDNRYWDDEVRHPAILFLARNGPKRQGSEESPEFRAKSSRLSENPPPALLEKGKGKDKGKGKRKKGFIFKKPRLVNKEGLYITDGAGREICFAYAGAESCRGRCPFSRSHVCQHCLGEHPNARCKPEGRGGR